ncbi:M13 family peptidase [Nocardia yunnanensis]|uniref:M13 family peptidase n=1 Tax=Nocardia yunnanensis TaxID=2382165 RepID=A0A386ZK98_9NOCA|nr:M13 family metallopeptidase [Nocardia yunnanensis]AYF77025.1 M13 family peptidase [Nocardia yunnanensis]
MTSSGLDRRRFLIALGLAPAVATLAACGHDTKNSVASTQLTGPDMSGSDPAVRPQDDLFRYVNGKWLADYQLPADKVSFGTFDEVQERVTAQLREIIEGIQNPKPDTTEQRIRDLYDARLDTDTFEKLGMTPLAGMFADIDQAADKAALAKVMAALPIGGLIGLSVSVDRKNSAAHVPTVSQSGIGLGEQYYRKPEYADKLAGYRTFLEKIATGAGFADPVALAGRVLDLEKRIAAGFWDNIKLHNTEASYNKMSWTDMVALAPQFDWDPWLSGNTDRPKSLFATVIVGEPSFVTAAGQLWHDVDIALWREYLKLSVVREYARYLPKAISDANFEFFGTVMSGQQQRPELWKSAVGTVDSTIGEQLGKLYVAKHFPPEAKQRALDMVADLIAAYKENFTNSPWMSQPTRDAALVKLGKMGVKIGYPDKWEDYSGLRVTRGQLIQSLRAANVFESKKMFDKLDKPVDKSEWGMTPQTVNAYYQPVNNEIVFPAAFLQPPFFDANAEAAVNFGAGGAVIGHEIGHGFDDQGSKYDADGNLKDWWSPQDRAKFDALTQKIVDQYNGLVPAGLDPAHHVDGQLTLSENVADNRGLQMAFAAYRINQKRAGVADPDYKDMLESWGRNWRSKQTSQYTENLIANDVHSPDEFRANQVVRNQAEFYATFQAKDGDKLFLPEDQRVTF